MLVSNSDGAPGAATFACVHCGASVSLRAPGTRHRNHCPRCLHSVHRDQPPGARAARCGAVLPPLAVVTRGDGEWSLLHHCTVCGALRLGCTAGDDNPAALLALAARASMKDLQGPARAEFRLPSLLGDMHQESPPLVLGGATFDATSRELTGPNGATRLEPRIAQVLVCLASPTGAVIRREQLREACWAGSVVGEDALHRCIAVLRRVARTIGDGNFAIETIPKTGYRLITPPPEVGEALDARSGAKPETAAGNRRSSS